MLALAIVLICVAILLGGFAWKFKLERGRTHFHRANSLAGLLAVAFAAASLWAFIAASSGNDSKLTAQQQPSDIPTATTVPTSTVTATATATVTATPTPTSTPTPTATKTKGVQRTRSVPPSTTTSTVVVNAPAVNPQPAATTSRTTPKPAPTHAKSKPRPHQSSAKPSPTKAKPKPAKPTIVNVTTLASMNVHDDPNAQNSSQNFCAVGNLPGHDEGVMTFTSVYGSFSENVFTGSDIGGGCAQYIAPSIVPPGGTDTVTVTLRDMNTGQSAVPNVQTIKIQYTVHP